MSLAELEKEVQNLNPRELQAFTRWLGDYLATLPPDESQQAAIGEGTRRMEEIIRATLPG